MKRSVFSIFVLLCISFVYAQSGTTRFIDSPSWVLAEEEGQVDVARVQDSRATEAKEAVLPSENDAKQSPDKPETTSTTEKPAKKKKDIPPSKPSEEGFLHIGVYATPVINWLSSVSKPVSRSGVNMCVTPTVMFDMRMIGRLYFGVGASLNTIGGKLRLSDTMGLTHTRSTWISYVEVPLRLKWQTRNFTNSRGSVFLSAGLNLGFGVRYWEKDTYEGMISIAGMSPVEGVFKTHQRMEKESRRLVNVAGVAQIGYNYQLAKRINLIIGVEYHYGFVRPVKNQKQYQYRLDKPSYNNQQVGLILGVMF